MQQAAVNLALGQAAGEILAVSGPPGTGKTTLLRDVVAGLVPERASVMAGLDDPEQAFAPSGHKLKVGNGWLQMYRLNNEPKGSRC
jgi:ABC-type transport system involved in cytochrome c biogenesis ATPase subunit